MGVINLSSKDNNKLNDQIFNNVINLISHAVYIVSKKYNHATKICLLSSHEYFCYMLHFNRCQIAQLTQPSGSVGAILCLKPNFGAYASMARPRPSHLLSNC